MRNLYELLGARPDDDSESLRKAFLKAAKESHPDHHGNDPEAAERFRQITEAYDVLRDAGRRAAYDRLLESERRPVRAKLKSGFSDAKRHAVTDAISSVLLMIVLICGYELFLRTSETPIDKGAVTARDRALSATAESARQGGGAQRDRLAAAPTPQKPNSTVAEIATGEIPAVAGRDLGSSVPAHPERANARPGAPEKDDLAKDQRDKPPEQQEAEAAYAPSSSPSVDAQSAAPERQRHAGGMKQVPGSRAGSPRRHTALVRYGRPPFERDSFKRAWLASRDTPARMGFEYCEGFERVLATSKGTPVRMSFEHCEADMPPDFWLERDRE